MVLKIDSNHKDECCSVPVMKISHNKMFRNISGYVLYMLPLDAVHDF